MVWLHGMNIPMGERYESIDPKVEKEIQARSRFSSRLESIGNCFVQSDRGETGYVWDRMKEDLRTLYFGLSKDDQKDQKDKYQATLESIDMFAKTEKEGLLRK